jgi:EmrB/QacA subfamily drug resistance transporter
MQAVAFRGAAEGQRLDRRWLGLVFIGLAQLMVALDATIVNIALPSAQADLRFSDAERQWVITAYTLSFGGLLLLGGRVADSLGRKRSLLIGLSGFALASAASGAAGNLGLLMAGRALQGAFGALLAPTALSLLAVTFTEPRERARAFAVYGGIAGSGGAAGLVLGGTLAQFLSWRWCLYVNVPVALVAALGAWLCLSDTRPSARRGFDLLGVILGGGGLVLLVDASGQTVGNGLFSVSVLARLALACALLLAFGIWQARSADPLLPPRLVLDRNRAGAYLCVALAIVGMFGAFLCLTYELQVVLRFPPLLAGVAFLPLSGAALASSGLLASRLLPYVPPRLLIAPAFVVAATGLAVLSSGTDYFSRILPAEVLLGLGIGCVMVPAISLGTSGVDPRDAGVASATVNTAQQVGASLGTAVLNTLATSATAASLNTGAARPEALAHGYTSAAAWGALALLASAGLSAWLITSGRPAQAQR